MLKPSLASAFRQNSAEGPFSAGLKPPQSSTLHGRCLRSSQRRGRPQSTVWLITKADRLRLPCSASPTRPGHFRQHILRSHSLTSPHSMRYCAILLQLKPRSLGNSATLSTQRLTGLPTRRVPQIRFPARGPLRSRPGPASVPPGACFGTAEINVHTIPDH